MISKAVDFWFWEYLKNKAISHPKVERIHYLNIAAIAVETIIDGTHTIEDKLLFIENENDGHMNTSANSMYTVLFSGGFFCVCLQINF